MATSSIFASVNIDTPEKAERFARALELAEQDGLWQPDPNMRAHFTTKEDIDKMIQEWSAKHSQVAK